MTADAISVLKVADEIIQHEKNTAGPSSTSRMNGEDVTPSTEVTPSIEVIAHQESDKTSSPQALNSDSFIEDLGLPDTLDDFPLLNKGSKTSEPVLSSLQLTLSGKNQSSQFPKKDITLDTSNHGVNSLESFFEKSVSQPNISQHHSLHNQKATDINRTSFESSKESTSGDHSTSAHSSVATNSKEVEEVDAALAISRQQMLREQYSRDFEVPQTTEKKKWSVMLEPFSAQAEVVNRQNKPGRTNEKVSAMFQLFF